MLKKVKKLSLRIALYILPQPIFFRLWHLYIRNHARSDENTASDKRRITINDSVLLDVFWVDNSLGPGPGASLYVYGEEVLRLDCFGNSGLTGHYHINPTQSELASPRPARLYFPPGTYEDQIERASFELERNLLGMIAMNRHPRIRLVEIDQVSLSAAAQEMKSAMLQLVNRHQC